MVLRPAVAAETPHAPATGRPEWRSRGERLASAFVVAALTVVLLYFPDKDDGSGALLGGIVALPGVWLGLTAINGLRTFPARDMRGHLRLGMLALAAGAALGLLNLGLNYGLAVADPLIRDQMVERWAEFSAWSVVVAEPVLEEIVFRLLLMGAIAWVTARFTQDRRTIFLVALGLSSALFGLAHVFYGGVDSASYQIGIAVKTSILALSLGWIFWRWGLPHAMAAHCTANAVHLVLWPLLF